MGSKLDAPLFLVLKGFIILLMVFKLSYLGKGALSFPDENRYIRAYKGIEAACEGNFHLFFREVFINSANPGFQLYCMGPSLIQIAIEKKLNINHLSFKSLLIPQLFNLLVMALILYYINSLASKSINKTQTLLLLLFFSYSLSSTIYLRHLFPYDLCILFFLIIVNKIQSLNFFNLKKVFLIGVFTSFMFSIYTGYFFLVAIITLLVFFNSNIGKIKTLVYFFLGFVPLLFTYEIFAQTAGTSYIMSLLHHSSTISQGDFQEGLSFPYVYSYEREKLFGLAIILFSGIYLIKKVKKITRFKNYMLLDQLIVISFIFFFIYALQCYFLEKLIWYGRIAHFFILLMTIAMFKFFSEEEFEKSKFFLPSVILLTTINIIFFPSSYLEIDYPRDIIEKEKLNIKFKEDFKFSINGELPLFPFRVDSSFPRKTASNCGFLWPTDATKKKDINKPPEKELKPINHFANKEKSFIHYLNFKPYQMEGFNKSQRLALRSNQIKITIVNRN